MVHRWVGTGSLWLAYLGDIPHHLNFQGGKNFDNTRPACVVYNSPSTIIKNNCKIKKIPTHNWGLFFSREDFLRIFFLFLFFLWDIIIYFNNRTIPMVKTSGRLHISHFGGETW